MEGHITDVVPLVPERWRRFDKSALSRTRSGQGGGGTGSASFSVGSVSSRSGSPHTASAVCKTQHNLRSNPLHWSPLILPMYTPLRNEAL